MGAKEKINTSKKHLRLKKDEERIKTA